MAEENKKKAIHIRVGCLLPEKITVDFSTGRGTNRHDARVVVEYVVVPSRPLPGKTREAYVDFINAVRVVLDRLTEEEAADDGHE